MEGVGNRKRSRRRQRTISGSKYSSRYLLGLTGVGSRQSSSGSSSGSSSSLPILFRLSNRSNQSRPHPSVDPVSVCQLGGKNKQQQEQQEQRTTSERVDGNVRASVRLEYEFLYSKHFGMFMFSASSGSEGADGGAGKGRGWGRVQHAGGGGRASSIA